MQKKSGDIISIQPQPKLKQKNTSDIQTIKKLEDKSWWPTIMRPEQPLVQLQPDQNSEDPAIAILVFGLSGQRLVDATTLIVQRQRRRRDFIPVFLTDSPELLTQIPYGYICEYFPKHAYYSIDNVGVMLQKFKLIWKKWNIKSFIDLSEKDYLISRFGDDWFDEFTAEAKRATYYYQTTKTS